MCFFGQWAMSSLLFIALAHYSHIKPYVSWNPYAGDSVVCNRFAKSLKFFFSLTMWIVANLTDTNATTLPLGELVIFNRKYEKCEKEKIKAWEGSKAGKRERENKFFFLSKNQIRIVCSGCKTQLLLCENGKHLCSRRCFYQCLALLISCIHKSMMLRSYFKAEAYKLPVTLQHFTHWIPFHYRKTCLFFLCWMPNKFSCWCCYRCCLGKNEGNEPHFLHQDRTFKCLYSSLSLFLADFYVFIMLFTFDKHMHSHYSYCFYCNAVSIEATIYTILHTEKRKEWSTHKAMHK